MVAAGEYSAELGAAVAEIAARDADQGILFLREIGLGATPDKPRSLPPAFLLHLGAVLRLFSWEAQGIFLHRAAGLPEARQALREVFRLLTDPDVCPTKFANVVLRLWVQNFAWHGPRELAADVALGELTDDAALDALAEYLWANRHAEAAADGPQR